MMPEATATPENIQALINGDGVEATVILLERDTDYPPIEIINKHGLSIIGAPNARINGVEIERSSYITLQDFEVYGTKGSGVSMEWKPEGGKYLQNNILISRLRVYDCGAGIAVIGDNITVEQCLIEHLVQRGGDMDFFRVWGDNNLIRNNTLDGRSLSYGSAHVDAVQCWARAGDVDKWLGRFTFEGNTIIGGDEDIHQGVMFEGKRITGPILIKGNSFSNVCGSTIIARDFELTSQDNNFINSAPGKAENRNGQGKIISINDTYNGSPAEFNEVKGGTVVYQKIEEAKPDPIPDHPLPSIEDMSQFDAIKTLIDDRFGVLNERISIVNDRVKGVDDKLQTLTNRRYEVRSI